MLSVLTPIAFAVHIGGGFVALVAGSVAILARKGGRVHRAAGTIFVASMLIMAVFAAILAVIIPDQLVNVFISIFTTYLVLTAWLTVRRRPGEAGLGEKVALPVALILCAPFALLSLQLATGMTPILRSAVPLTGAVRIAIFVFTTVLAIAVLGDAKVVFGGGVSGAPRIARHLWRMCLGLTLAFGSAFTNGFARLLPGLYHVPLAFFLPQFAPLLSLAFWLIRVRFTRWTNQSTVPATA
ncbi:MAG: DUF2306 domain-containing protein [Vitreimonas sp.]